MAPGRSEIRRAGTLAIIGSAFCLWLAAPAPARAQSTCVGDCNNSKTVTINEIIECVNIALGTAQLSTCAACSANGSSVQVTDLITAVNNALNGCGSGGTATATPVGGGATATPTVTPSPMPNSCPLQPGKYTITSGVGGVLQVASFSPFAFPAGGTIIGDVGPGDANCVHKVTVPFTNPVGFQSPVFCIPALGFTVMVTQRACGIGQIDSDGGADYTVTELGDTSFTSATCSIPASPCPPAGPALDSSILVRVTVGDGTVDTCTGNGKANALLAVPVQTLTWLESSSGASCPANDGTFNPDQGDAKISEFPQTLDFTTDTTTTKFQDLDGDGCSKTGVGPAAGFNNSTGMNTGVCMDLTAKTVTTVASGTVGSSGAPTYDLAYRTKLPNTFTGPDPLIGATCDTPPEINFNGTVDRCIKGQ